MKKTILFIVCILCVKISYSQISIVIDSVNLQFISIRVQKECKNTIPLEGMYSGPDITIFLSIVNVSDTPVVIKNDRMKIGFCYTFKKSIFRFPQHSLTPLFQDCMLLPGQKVEFFICSSVFAPTFIEEKYNKKYNYTYEIKRILPTLRAWIAEEDNTIYSEPCKFFTYSIPFEIDGCFYDNLGKHFVEKMNKLLSKKKSRNQQYKK